MWKSSPYNYLSSLVRNNISINKMEDPIKEITEFFKKQFDETLDMYKVNSYDFCTFKRIEDFIEKKQQEK